MRRERKAQIITVVILAGAVAVAVGRKTGWQMPSRISDIIPLKTARTAPTPQDAIYEMMDAARQGDSNKYLSYYTGQMEASIKQTIAESNQQAFAKYLRESNASVKGVAITEPQPLTEREVKVRVEYVYQDRNEVQYMYLEKIAGLWKIARVDSAERVKTLIPYGTPVE
jgi:hypothetical protein